MAIKAPFDNMVVREKVKVWMANNKTTATTSEPPTTENLKKYLLEQEMNEAEVDYGVSYYAVVILPFGVK